MTEPQRVSGDHLTIFTDRVIIGGFMYFGLIVPAYGQYLVRHRWGFYMLC